MMSKEHDPLAASRTLLTHVEFVIKNGSASFGAAKLMVWYALSDVLVNVTVTAAGSDPIGLLPKLWLDVDTVMSGEPVPLNAVLPNR